LAVPLERKAEAESVFDYIDSHLRSHRTRRPFIVHRIDRDTSGVVIFAKHAAAQATLKQQFLRHEPERVYQAVVYGHPTPPSGTWRDTLVWDQRSLIQKETHLRRSAR
jgi:23S rRNA pseudouridine1911/1915/1917 synthase